MEKRKYNEDSTPEEIELMRARVYMLENSVIYMDEAPVVSPFQIEVMYRKVNELVKPNQENYFLINLVDTKPPKPADRAKLRELMKISAPDIIHTAVYTEKNKIINLVAKFCPRRCRFSKLLYP